MERLEHLFDLGLHHQLHVEGDLAADAGDEAEEAADLGDAVVHRVPGDLRLGEVELLGELDLGAQAVLAERGQRAGRAAELEHEARARLSCFSRCLWRSKAAR